MIFNVMGGSFLSDVKLQNGYMDKDGHSKTIETAVKGENSHSCSYL